MADPLSSYPNLPGGAEDGTKRHSDSTIFIGNLSFFCKESDIIDMLSAYGKAKNVEFARSPEGNNLLYGYIELDDVSQAQQCAADLNGRLHKGRHLRVRLAAEPPSATVDRKDMSGPSFTVHVRFVTHNPVLVVDEEFLYNLFQPFGEIVDISIRRYYRQIRRQYGYAFVEYKLKEDAKTASGHFEHFESGGVKLFSTISHRSIKSWAGDDESGSDRTGEADFHKRAHQAQPSLHRRAPTSNMVAGQVHSQDPRNGAASNRRSTGMANGSAPSYYPGYSNPGSSPSMAVMLPPGYPIAVAPAYFPMSSSMIPPPPLTHNSSSASNVYHRSSGSSQPFIAFPQHLLSQHSWSQGSPTGTPSSAPANYVSHPYSFPGPVSSSGAAAPQTNIPVVPNTVHPPQSSNQLPYYSYAQPPSSPMMTMVSAPSYPPTLGAPRPVSATSRVVQAAYYPPPSSGLSRTTHGNPDSYENSISSAPPHPSNEFR